MTRPPLATPREVSAYLSKSVKTLKNWRCNKTGPKYQKVNGTVRYRWSDVDAWLEQQSGVAA